MVLTPQLLQAIKLLQMPTLELSAFVETELASNPLLELAEDRESRSVEASQASEGEPEGPSSDGGVEAGDWASDSLEVESVLPPTSARRSRTPSSRTALPQLRRPTNCPRIPGP
jgi:DNA-directed RNA polymerase specialized sigma54-like protein